MTKREQARIAAIVKGLQWARDHGFEKDGDVAIAIVVELKNAGFRI